MLKLRPAAACRPRPGREVPRSPEDVQRFYIIMMPTSRKAPVRLLTMGTTKRMPAQGERFWGAVLDTGHSVHPSQTLPQTTAPDCTSASPYILAY